MNGRKKKVMRVMAAAMALLLAAMCASSALAEAFSAIVVTKTMVVYADAAMSQKLGTLPKNTVVQVTGFSSTVAKISYDGNAGYASISDLRTVDEVAKKAVLNAAAPVFQEPQGDSASVMAPAGTRLYVLAVSEDWAMVEHEGMVGYVKTGFLTQVDDTWSTPAPETTEAAEEAQSKGITVRSYEAVATGNVKVYKAASTKAKVLGTLKKDAKVTVKATSSNGWAYIQLNGKAGYCKASALKETSAEAAVTPVPTQAPQTATVKAKTLTVYKKASKSAKKLGKLKKGQTVTVVSWNSKWACVELNGKQGYCAVSGLTRTESPEVTPGTTFTPDLSNARKATVTVSSLKVYKTASSKGKKLGTLKKGKVVNLLQTSNGWAYIELDGKYGFCSEKGLKVQDSVPESDVPGDYKEANFTATVIDPNAKVYASTSADAENKKLKLGEEVQVKAYSAQWACVAQGDSQGFVPIKQLSKTSYPAIDSDCAELQTLLKALLSGGYYDGVPSTVYNAAAISAIKRFQSACGLDQTGLADQTVQRIAYGGLAPVSDMLFKELSSGDKTDNVSRLQARLYALGYLTKTTSLDGEFGTTTTKAVKLFQTANGLTDSGKADTTTLKALYSTGAKGLPTGTTAADATTSRSSNSSSTYLDSVPSGLASTTSSYNSGMSAAEKLEYTIYLAQNQLGKPYVYGATGPDKYDCSGLTTYIFKAVGVSLKRSAYNQGYDESYQKIEGVSALRRGDLVFFNTISDSDLSDHVGIYLGEGYFIHASSGGHRVVVSNLTSGFYNRVYSWGRRILG